MAGTMAGSAILAARSYRDALGTVTLTINNVCNLSCPHCYLQYDGPSSLIDPAVIDHLFDTNFDRLCIVGKEPLADTRSIEVVRMIVERASALGVDVSIVTNGLNGHLLPDCVVQSLTWLDVSLDGGRDTYEAYRGGSWPKLQRSLESMKARGLRELRVLQTLSTATVCSVADMIESGFAIGASLMLFSPYQPTRSYGTQRVSAISPIAIVEALKHFADDPRIHLAFDFGYTRHFEDHHRDRAFSLAARLFGERFTYVSSDPVNRGIIRVTYDGLVLTPFQAVNTVDYRSIGRPVLARPIDEWFTEMLHASRPALVH